MNKRELENVIDTIRQHMLNADDWRVHYKMGHDSRFGGGDTVRQEPNGSMTITIKIDGGARYDNRVHDDISALTHAGIADPSKPETP